MVISHDCDCDKFLKPKTPIPEEQRPVWPITMAPVHPLEQVDTRPRQRFATVRCRGTFIYLRSEGYPSSSRTSGSSNLFR